MDITTSISLWHLLLSVAGICGFVYTLVSSINKKISDNDKRLALLEKAEGKFETDIKEIKSDIKEMKTSINKLSQQMASLVAALRSKSIINGHPTKENTWYNK